MPVEPTQAKLKRRASRKELGEDFGRYDAGHARELEAKRNRVSSRRVARNVEGSLSTGQGTRFVLAATEHLHRRIGALSSRIRLLEDALTSLQASHPLLHPDLVARGADDDLCLVDEDVGERGYGERGQGGAEAEKGGKKGAGDVIDAFGTLSISDHGISRFFGPTGGVESLLISNLTPTPGPSSSPPTHAQLSPLPSSSPSSTSSLPPDPLSLFSSSFPFTPLGSPTGIQALVASHLPPRSIADGLVQTYLEQCSWLFHGVTEGQLGEMIRAVYGRIDGQGGEEADIEGEGEYSGPHDLALLFTIFAIGALVRPSESHNLSSSPPHNPSPSTTPTSLHTRTSNALGEHYHQLARAAMALQPVLEKPSIETIQGLHLLSIYNAMSGRDLGSETSMEMTWSLITLAGHLSMTIGLHRDSARWGLTPKMVQRRRILFWDLFVADVWQSLNTGRPPSFSLAYIDCSFPDDGSACKPLPSLFLLPSELTPQLVSIWQCRFAAECVADVTSRTLTAEAPTYATIMELDRKVREFPLPEGMSSSSGSGGAAKGGEGDEDMAISFQRCVLDHIRETVLMYIHRSFFAQAIIEHPANPLKSAYAPSFLAAYRAASTILKSVREQFGIWPNSCARFWTMWTFAFSAAGKTKRLIYWGEQVVFGTVVTRGPRSPLAQSAMGELEQACILFSKASVYSIRAAKALPILSKLAEKARHALKDPPSLSDAAGGLLWRVPVKQEKDEDDELAIFAGHTRFVSSRKNAPQSLPQQRHQQHQRQEVNGWPGPVEYMDISVSPALREERNAQPLSVPLHHPYAPSERSTHVEHDNTHSDTFGQAAREWEEADQGYQRQGNGQMQMMEPPRVVPSQFYPAPAPSPHPQQHYRAQLQHILGQQQGYTTHMQVHPAPYPHSHAHIHSYQNVYPQHQHQPNTELADLGLAARDSRLDERWSSFMQESGILEDVGFRGR
ncbi:hypothetical protein DXG01_009897 [Tephrocybe rancida]|nr:hypothetical protein DXG01_009897 [Tephrocybe rancida]